MLKLSTLPQSTLSHTNAANCTVAIPSSTNEFCIRISLSFPQLYFVILLHSRSTLIKRKYLGYETQVHLQHHTHQLTTHSARPCAKRIVLTFVDYYRTESPMAQECHFSHPPAITPVFQVTTFHYIAIRRLQHSYQAEHPTLPTKRGSTHYLAEAWCAHRSPKYHC